MTEQEYANNVKGYEAIVTELGKGFLKPTDVAGSGNKPEYSRDPGYQSDFIIQLKNAEQALLSDMNFFKIYQGQINNIADSLLKIISRYVEDSPQNQNLINAVIQHNKVLLKAANIPERFPSQ